MSPKKEVVGRYNVSKTSYRTEPSAVAPGETQLESVIVALDPALPRSVLCAVTCSILVDFARIGARYLVISNF